MPNTPGFIYILITLKKNGTLCWLLVAYSTSLYSPLISVHTKLIHSNIKVIWSMKVSEMMSVNSLPFKYSKTSYSVPPDTKSLNSYVVSDNVNIACFFFCLLYCWGSPFWGVWGEGGFLRIWPLFNPAIEVITFSLRRWCTPGVFLLLAFTCLGHGCQDLLSPCNVIHAFTD